MAPPKPILTTAAVIGCLMSAAMLLVVPMVVVRTAGYGDQARQVKIQTDLRAIIRAVQMYRATTGDLPESQMLKEIAGNGLLASGWPLDPWGHSYTCRVLSGRIRAVCLGPDGREGGPDDFDLEAPLEEEFDLPEFPEEQG